MEHDHDRWPEPTQHATVWRAALAYAERGWQVLPLWWPERDGACACGLPDCDSVAKHPIARLTPRGLHDATSHLGTVNGWWGSVPHANVGIRTGAASGLIVLDVDGQLGRLSLASLVASHASIRARWARSGGGGWHAYLGHPGGVVPSSAGRLGAGLDIRGDGGYVVAPPSRHRSRGSYRWVIAPDQPPPAPGWLLELARLPASERAPTPVRLHMEHAAAYAAAAVADEAHAVAHAPAGQRNHQLNRAAFRLGQLVGAGLLEERVATAALVDAGLAAGPGERKIRSTVRRGIDAGRRHPRQIVLSSSLAR